MTPLTKQLEDKKKEPKYMLVSNKGIVKDGHAMFFEDVVNDLNAYEFKVKRLQNELEQAIAEMQKQRQEILDKIRLEFHTFRKEFIESELEIEDFDIGNLLYNIEKQLNQPRTEE